VRSPRGAALAAITAPLWLLTSVAFLDGCASSSRGNSGSPADSAEAPFEFQIEKEPLPYQSNPAPVYPDSLRKLGLGGSVRVSFVVTEAGRVDMAALEVVAHERWRNTLAGHRSRTRRPTATLPRHSRK